MQYIEILQSAKMGIEKFKIISAFTVYINYNAVLFLQDLGEKAANLSVLDLLSIERVGSTGLLLVAIWWTVREMQRKEKLFLEQIEILREEHKKIMEEKEKKFDELLLKLIEEKKAD